MSKRLGLKQIRLACGDLTQAEAADRIGCSRSLYAAVELGKRDGSHKFWKKVQKAFNISDADMWKVQTKSDE